MAKNESVFTSAPEGFSNVSDATFTNGYIRWRHPQGTADFYDVSYFQGQKTAEGVQFPPDGSYLEPHSDYNSRFGNKSIALVDWIRSRIGEGKVLDVGAGPGHLKYWADQTKTADLTIVSADISTTLLTSQYNQNPNASVVASVSQLPFADGIFQGVVFSDILEHVWPAQAIKAVREARRVLAHGGVVFVNIPNRETWTDAAVKDSGHVWLPTRRETRILLRRGGFGKIKDVFTRGFPDSKVYQEATGQDLRRRTGGRSIFASAQK